MASRRFQIDITAWNGPQLANRVERALINCRPVFDKQLKEDIQTPQFAWTGKITQRRNGNTAGSPRDIVDTGAFLRSQRAQTRGSNKGNEIVFSWGNSQVNYAGYILTGNDGDPSYKARDWIAKALEHQPFERVFAAEWAKLERRGL